MSYTISFMSWSIKPNHLQKKEKFTFFICYKIIKQLSRMMRDPYFNWNPEFFEPCVSGLGVGVRFTHCTFFFIFIFF